MAPTATVIIPNYNNGRASSRDGSRDFLGDLLANLEAMLWDDPTDLEIVVGDDGSTDDSLDTLRLWASRTWTRGPRAGRPFLRLLELTHSGILSHVLNAIHAATEGEFVCRLDGDILIDTPRWVAECVGLLSRDPNVGVVTGLQKLPDGRVHAFGDAILSPLGYHHLCQGAREDELPEVLEVEHAMGCFHASRRAAIAAVGGYDETVMRGQTEELAMRLNLAGWKALATKRVVFRHFHAERHWRPNKADTGEGLARSLERFREKWGVDRLAPDLAEVWRRYAGTPLVERARLSAPRRWNPAETGDLAPGGEWERFASDPATQASIAQELAMLRATEGPTAVLGCRSGLTAFLHAREGADVVAFEEHAPSIDAANAFIARAAKPRGSLQLSTLEELSSTTGLSGAFRVVSLLDTLERTWNPVGVLGESRRLLAADGLLIVRARARASACEDRGESLHPFAAHELLQLVRHVGGFTPLAAPASDGMGRLTVVARRTGLAAHVVHFGAPKIDGAPSSP
jgi:glycosyltransferase involved in cell wall biosynthesis